MSAAMRERRGVLMTATARKRGSWKDLVKDDVEIGDSENEGVDCRKESQNEWAELEREVRSELRMKEFASGMGRGEAVNYDDVAGDEEEDDGPPSAPSSPEEGEADSNAAKHVTSEDALAPPGAMTAGDHLKEKKRGGEKKTGAARRKKKAGDLGEEGSFQKRKKVDEDPDRWLKMRLAGEEKPKKIDATRVVHYHDHDMMALSKEASSSIAVAGDSSGGSQPATTVSYRARLRTDLFDSDDDEA